MKSAIKIWAVLLIGCVPILSVCQNPTGGSEGEGGFTISLGNASNSRAAVYPPRDFPPGANPTNPPIDDFRFEVTFTPTSAKNSVKQFKFNGDEDLSGTIPAGFYTVVMDVYEIADDSYLYANGSVPGNVEIKKGIITPIIVDVYEAGVVIIDPASVSVGVGSTRQFTATVSGYANQDVTWTLSGGMPGTDIDSGGLLTIDIGETAATLTVTATSVADPDPSKSGTAAVTVVPSGSALWAKTINAGTNANFKAVAVAPDGAVYAAGYQNGTESYDYGGASASGTNSTYNPVLVKYDALGNALWAKTITAGTGSTSFSAVALAPDGTVYVAGSQSGIGSFDYGGVSINGPYTSSNPLLIKYDASGNALWAKTTTVGTGMASFGAIAVDPADGSVYVAGDQSGTGNFDYGSGIIFGSSSSNPVLVKYDTSGNALWAKTITAGTSTAMFYDVAVAPDGSVYAAGFQDGTGPYNYGSGNINGKYSDFNPILVKYDASGNAVWATTTIASSDRAQFNAVAVAPDGAVYAAGAQYYTGSFNYGGASTPISGASPSENPLLVKYDALGSAVWAKTTIASPGLASFGAVTVAPDGAVYAAGRQGSGSFNYGGASISGTGTTNPVLVKYDDASGSAVWATTITAGTSSAYFVATAVAPDNSVYSAGYQYGTTSFDYGGASAPISGTGTNNSVLVKYVR